MARFVRTLRPAFPYPGGPAVLNRQHMIGGAGLRLACVAQGGSGAPSMVDLLSGVVATNQYATLEVGTIGPSVYNNAVGTAANGFPFTAKPASETFNFLTMAAIFQWRGGTVGQGIVNANTLGNTKITVVNTAIAMDVASTVYNFPVLPVAGHSYFVAFSGRGTGVGNSTGNPRWFGVQVDLTTGVQCTMQSTASIGAPTGNTQYQVYTYGTGARPDPGRVAAAAIASIYLPPAKLLAWAKDPWGLWYAKPSMERMANLANVPVAATSGQTRVMVMA